MSNPGQQAPQGAVKCFHCGKTQATAPGQPCVGCGKAIPVLAETRVVGNEVQGVTVRCAKCQGAVLLSSQLPGGVVAGPVLGGAMILAGFLGGFLGGMSVGLAVVATGSLWRALTTSYRCEKCGSEPPDSVLNNFDLEERSGRKTQAFVGATAALVGAVVCGVLWLRVVSGPAKPEVAELVEKLSSEYTFDSDPAFEQIPRFGAAAVPALIDCLHTGHERAKWRCADLLGRIGPEAKDAVPVLQGLLTQADLPRAQLFSFAKALRFLGPEGEAAFSELSNSPHERVRKIVVDAKNASQW